MDELENIKQFDKRLTGIIKFANFLISKTNDNVSFVDRKRFFEFIGDYIHEIYFASFLDNSMKQKYWDKISPKSYSFASDYLYDFLENKRA